MVFCVTVALLTLVGILAFHQPAYAKVSSQTASTCESPPPNIDNSTLSDADLARYGLPKRGSMPLAKWEDFIHTAQHRICTPLTNSNRTHSPGHTKLGSPNNANELDSPNWEGNVANGSDGPYVEADAVFFVPQIAYNSPTGDAAIWVGLGGYGNKNLVQAGVTLILDSNGQYSYKAWVQNLAVDVGEQDIISRTNNTKYVVQPGDRMQVQISGGDNFYVGDGNQLWYYSNAYGPSANTSTAEWIVERNYTVYSNGIQVQNPLVDFGSVTFYGMGDTEANGTYTGPYWQTHDYFVAKDGAGNQVMNLGGLNYNTLYGPPNDSNQITWLQNI